MSMFIPVVDICGCDRVRMVTLVMTVRMVMTMMGSLCPMGISRMERGTMTMDQLVTIPMEP